MTRMLSSYAIRAFVLISLADLTVPACCSAADTAQIPPMTNFWGTRGLTQIASAEPLGAGRLTVCATGTWYQQEVAFEGTPNSGANIGTGLVAFSFGASDYIDLFAALAGFGASKYDYDNSSGLGSISAGVQGMLPLPSQAPFRLGAQAVVIGGTSRNQLDRNRADGYDYFETRTGYDIVGRAIEAIVIGDESLGLKFLLNQAFSTSVQEHANLMMLSGGIQAILATYYVLGVEGNSRTYLSDVQMTTDPLWLTPSITFRTPYFVSFNLGCDVALSQQRAGAGSARALEPYRLFGGLTFSADVLARKRREAAAEAKRVAAEKAALEAKTKSLESQTDSLSRMAEKARLDSIAHIRQADSLAEATGAMMKALAEKATADSLALAETQRKLEIEGSKRSDAEKQLLSTGMLILDAVYFESGKAEISMNSLPYLRIIAKMLGKYPKLKLEVAGHTDNVGKYDFNQRLSQLRAEAVRAYLADVEPQLLGRLAAVGYGPSQPKAANTTADGRKRNRRTELVVTNKDVLQEYK